MKSKLTIQSKLVPSLHKVRILERHAVCEVWYDGKLIAAVCGGDGPGVRIISKFPILAKPAARAMGLNTLIVQVEDRE